MRDSKGCDDIKLRVRPASKYPSLFIYLPNPKYMWVLSRTPAMDETTFQGILNRAKQKGYDLTGVMRAQQSGK